MSLDNNDNTRQERVQGRRWASDIAAGAVLCAFFVFMAGYFIGKRGAVEEVTQRAECDSFADCIYSSFQGLHDNEWAEAAPIALAELSQPDEPETLDMPSVAAGRMASAATISEETFEVASASTSSSNKKFYAQLAGFRTANAANKLSARLCDRGVKTEVKKRKSRTSRGAEHAWYQVVTVAHNERQPVENIVDRVSREEKIKGAQIVTC